MNSANATSILHLPAELVQIIFLIVLQASSHSEAIRTSIILSSINAFWRNIALNTPELWTRIQTRNPEWANILLQRSGSQLLSINIGNDGPRGESQENNVWVDVLDVLIEHSDRWEHLVLHRQVTLDDDVFGHLTEIKGRISSLNSLHVVRSENLYKEWDVFSVAPSLRVVEWDHYRPECIFPFQHVKVLKLRWAMTEDLIPVLPTLTELVVLKLHSYSSEEIDVSDMPCVVLPRLRYLEFEGYSADKFLDSVSLPSLRRLKLSGGGGDRLSEHLKRWKCQDRLRELSFKMSLKDEQLLSILSQAPNLRSLAITFLSCIAITPAFFQALTVPSDDKIESFVSKILCRRLEVLKFKNYRGHSELPPPLDNHIRPWVFSVPGLLNMIESRRASRQSAFAHVYFSGIKDQSRPYNTLPDGDSRERMMKLRREGFDIVFKVLGQDLADPSSDAIGGRDSSS